jgi:uncharacterized protein YndB with AHSA1/START domain
MVNRHQSHTVAFPSPVEVVYTRSFDAPIDLVFAALSQSEHIRAWGATGDDRMTVCDIDLRVGGKHRSTFITADETPCTFWGDYLEVEAPTRIVSSWHFDGWPDVSATITETLVERDEVTTLTRLMVFNDVAGAEAIRRAHDRERATGVNNGQGASFDALEDVVSSLVANNAWGHDPS